jgi:sulfite reductase (ferredoxin)
MSQAATWKAKLAGQLASEWEQNIDVFETQIALKRQDKIDDKIFAETRLHLGIYGQRYDNGQRHDGVQTQPLNYPSGGLTKEPQTLWDAPGMQRNRIARMAIHKNNRNEPHAGAYLCPRQDAICL